MESNNWINSIKILRWSLFKETCLEFNNILKNSFLFFKIKLLVFYVVSFFIIYIVSLVNNPIGTTLFWCFLIYVNFAFSSVMYNIIHPDKMVTSKQGLKCFIKWLCISILSNALSLIVTIFIIASVAAFVALCFLVTGKISRLLPFDHFVQSAGSLAASIWFVIPTGFVSCLIYFKDKRIWQSSLRGSVFAFRFLPIFLIMYIFFGFCCLGCFLLFLHVIYPCLSEANLVIAFKIAPAFYLTVTPFIYIFYLSVFATIYSKLEAKH